MTHLVDTSVWHQYGRNPAVQKVVDGLVSRGALLTTCPVVIAEYSFSARTPRELRELQADLGMLYLLESDNLAPYVRDIQLALWAKGLARAAGAEDCLIAAYAIAHRQTVVTCDADFVHIARALVTEGTALPLSAIHIAQDGSVLTSPPHPDGLPG